MVKAFRIFKTKHSASWFDGEGARLYGGRWNSQGVRLLYTSATLSLAALEILVHIGDQGLLSAYSFATVEFADESILPIDDLGKLPADWSSSPAPIKLQQIGDAWASSVRSAVLRVPTSIVPGEYNYLANLDHPDAAKYTFGNATPFLFDGRLSGKGKNR